MILYTPFMILHNSFVINLCKPWWILDTCQNISFFAGQAEFYHSNDWSTSSYVTKVDPVFINPLKSIKIKSTKIHKTNHVPPTILSSARLAVHNLRGLEFVGITKKNWVLNFEPNRHIMCIYVYLVGGIPTPLKIWVRQLGLLFPIYGKIKNVPNHQPARVVL